MPAQQPGMAPPASTATISICRRTFSPAAAKGNDLVIALLPPKPKLADFKRLGQSKAIFQRWQAIKKRSVNILATDLLADGAARLCITSFEPAATTFEQMCAVRQLLDHALQEQPGKIAITAIGLDEPAQALALLVEGLLIATYALPDYGTGKSRNALKNISVFQPGKRSAIDKAIARAEANNRVRWLGALPPNKLSTRGFRRYLSSLAKTLNCTHEFLGEAKLKKLGAGAFVAVSQGNAERDAGIVRLSYRPRAQKRVALVGKGIIFDTGGNNLKPFKGMLDMHLDMLGSAVAVSSFEALVRAKVDYGVDCWLAITENRVSANAYKSRDVVTALNGKTIEAIHTDAEGRMALADTLVLASRRKPALILDFATLTGACVTALTSRQSGVFSNREALHSTLIATGRRTGERVWPFPIGAENDEQLKSETADLIQCPVDGSGDHILAARFLSHFVPAAIPWVHMDLSAATRAGGLGLTSTEITGFGPRYTLALLENLDKLLKDSEDV